MYKRKRVICMDYNIIRLRESLEKISNKRFFKKFFIRRKIYESKKSLKKLILDKDNYNALDIIAFVNSLKMMKILGLDVIDDKISYTYANQDISNDINFAILSYNTEYDIESTMKIVYKAKIENQLDRVGSIDIEYINTNVVDDGEYSDKIDKSTRYSISTKSINKNNTQNSLEILHLSYEVLHNIFLIYIEKILDEIEREYINEN